MPQPTINYRARASIESRAHAHHLNAAIRELPADSMRFAQLSTQALINTAYAAIDMDLLGPDWDALDRSVPSVEAHAQNAYQDGVVHLCVLLTDLLPILVERDVAYAANLARAWRSIPSVLGQRLWVHAQRSRVLFSSDQVAQNLLELPADAFWTMRRELVLAITERMGAASPHLIHHLLRRVLDESPTLYAEFSQGEGETDWRPQARSHRVWLLLTALKVAGVLPDEGVRVLADIAQQYPYIAGDFREEDLFGVYSSGVSSVQGDATTLIDAIPGERLQLAKQLISEADYEAQASWAAYCRAEPTAAFEVLRNADIDADNSRLWSDFLNVLVVAGLQETTRSIALDLMPKAFAKLSAAPEGVIVPLMPALTHLLPIRQATDDSDIFEQWWDRLWAIAEHHEDEFDLTTDCQRLLDRAINSSAGRLTERLLESVNRARLATGVSADDRKRLERTLEAREPARWMAGAICARSAGFILLVHPKAALRHLRRCLMKDDVEGRALRAVLLAAPPLSMMGTRAFKGPIFAAAVEMSSTGAAATNAAGKFIFPLIHWHMEANGRGRPPLSIAEARVLLTKVPSTVLAGAARCFRQWLVEGQKGSARDWGAIAPLFEAIWPSEAKFRREPVAQELASLCVSAGPAFPDALNAIRHHFLPLEGGWGGGYFMKQLKVPQASPEASLELLWLICGPAASGQTQELAEILDAIAEAAPALEVDRRYQWLEQHRAIRYA